MDNGELLPQELDWYDSEIEMEDLGDGEFQKNYINIKKGGQVCPEKLLTQMLLEDLLAAYFSTSTETLYDDAIERKHYTIHIQEDKSALVPKKSWWRKFFC